MADTMLQIKPDSEILFSISQSEPPPKAYLTLTHKGGSSSDPIAFKVKTTQPRRYLVRPNQGLITPGATAQVQILLVEKDVQQLWTNYTRLGQASLDHCKDKFLVQSTSVSPREGVTAGDYDRLTSFWTNVHSATSSHHHEAEIHHKKFPVRHVGVNGTPAAGAAVPGTSSALPPTSNILAQQQQQARGGGAVTSTDAVQLQTELTNLSRKYDELVAFSVNLTAERDILNNTLEQTKRDLNRQLQSAAAHDNKNASGAASGVSGSGGKKSGAGGLKSFLSTLFLLLATGSLSWLLGCFMQSHGQTHFLQDVPRVGPFLHEKINLVDSAANSRKTGSAAAKDDNDDGDNDDDDGDNKDEL